MFYYVTLLYLKCSIVLRVRIKDDDERYPVVTIMSPHRCCLRTGTLVSRMLGQNKSRHTELNTTTAPEFFARFPDLLPVLLRMVRGVTTATGGLSEGTFRPHASLFPVLSILGKLNTGAASKDDER